MGATSVFICLRAQTNDAHSLAAVAPTQRSSPQRHFGKARRRLVHACTDIELHNKATQGPEGIAMFM